MTSYVFAVTLAHGHVNPTLAIAQKLVQNGEKVTYYLPEEFRTSIEATGATFRSYHWETAPHVETFHDSVDE